MPSTDVFYRKTDQRPELSTSVSFQRGYEKGIRNVRGVPHLPKRAAMWGTQKENRKFSRTALLLRGENGLKIEKKEGKKSMFGGFSNERLHSEGCAKVGGDLEENKRNEDSPKKKGRFLNYEKAPIQKLVVSNKVSC